MLGRRKRRMSVSWQHLRSAQTDTFDHYVPESQALPAQDILWLKGLAGRHSRASLLPTSPTMTEAEAVKGFGS